MRFRYITLLLLLVPATLAQASTITLDPSSAVSTLNMLISQYESRIKQLESENAILRNEMMKAGIKIPLNEYSWAVLSTNPPVSTVPPIVTSIASWSTAPVSSWALWQTNSPSVVSGSIDTVGLTAQYGKDVSGFINKIHTDWKSIKEFYKIDSKAQIAWYEFVQSGSNDFTFVDIVIGTGTAGIYDIKMLYQFEKNEYKRKLIGIFDYSPVFTRYVTRAWGSNPFAWVPRTFIRDPLYTGVVSVPATVTPPTNSGSVTATVLTPATNPTTPQNPTSVADTADILKAYSEKKYLSTISLSNAYLEKNAPTVEILNIRYRTYFIIWKFTESLAELAKIEALGWLDRQTACNAQVIATYSKNSSLIEKYTAICKK